MTDDSGEALETGVPLQLAGPDNHLTAGRQRLLAVLEVLLCSSLPTQLLIAAILGMLGVAPRSPTDQLSLTFVVVLSLTDTAVLIGLMVVLARAHGDSAWLLWRGIRPLRGELVRGLLLVPAAVLMVGALINSVRLVAPWLHNVPDNPLESLATDPGGAALFGIVAIVAGGIREELQRAFLLQRFERHLGGATVGVVVLSVAFGLGHALQGWDAAIATGALGAFWAVLYLQRRSSVAPIVSHAGFNSIEVLRVALGGS